MNKFYLFAVVILAVPFATAAYQYNYTSDSSYVVPANVTILFVEAWGGGGAGQLSGNTDFDMKAGGGGGSYSANYISVTPSQNFTVNVGEGGTSITVSGGGSGSSINGNSSNFSISNTTYVFAVGGLSATSCINYGAGGSASSNTGIFRYSGGNGGVGQCGAITLGSGAGGGGAGSYMNGGAGGSGTAGVLNFGGYGGNNSGGAGANGSTSGGDFLGVAGSVIGGGGSGSGCDGGCGNVRNGGAGGRGEIRVTQYNNPVIIHVLDSSNYTYVDTDVNITLNNRDTFVSYSLVSTNGFFINESIIDGVYEVVIDAAGYNTNYALLTVNSGADATFYVDASTVSRLFNVRDGFAQAVENATITFSRTINSTLIAYTQVITDSSGYITVNLNPAFLYMITGTEPTGTYLNYTGSVLPNQDITYVIQFSFSPINPYYTPLNNTYTVIEANYYNSTKIINVTWEVISPIGDLEYFGLYTTYNSTNYSQNITGIPGGGIAYVNITGVDLSFQDTIYVTHYFKRTGYAEVSTVTTFNFLDYTPSNSSIIGGMFDGTNAPSSVPGRALLGTFIVLIVVAGTYSVTRMSDVATIAGLATFGILSVPTVAMFPLLYGVIVVVVGSVVLIARLR